MTGRSVDVLVVGAGMAGLTAGARVAALGASVLVVERASEIGGSATFAGYVWTAPTREVMAEINPHGEPALRNAVVDDFPAGLEWIRGRGVEVAEGVPVLRYGIGHAFDTVQYLNACMREISARGGVSIGADVVELHMGDGEISGATVRSGDGTHEVVSARSVILATGGFQADADLSAEHIHPAAPRLPLRSNPHSDGQGLRLATSVGAAVVHPDAGFYGHLIPADMGFRDSGDFVGLSLYCSEHALLFNTSARRFVDETRGDHLTAMALMEQPGTRGLLIADSRVYEEWICTSYVKGAVAVDKFAEVAKRGGRCGTVDDLDELAFLPEDWGYDGTAIAEEIRRVNAAGHRVLPPREFDFEAVDRGPFYVIEVCPAVTYPLAGVRIDDTAAVLRSDATRVSGLYAAGSDTGGVYRRAYAGGLANALVFGLRAAESAVSTARQAEGV